jgi:ATP-binding cassette, subfamily B, bacterial
MVFMLSYGHTNPADLLRNNMTQPTHEKLSPRDTLRIFYGESIKQRPYVFLALLLPLGAILLSVGAPYYAGKVLAGLAQGDAVLEKNLLLLAVISLVGVLFNRVGFQNTMAVQARALHSMHRMVFGHLLHRSVGFHANHVSGKLVSDALDFTSAFSNMLNAVYVSGIPFLLSVIVGLVIVIASSWKLGVLMIFIVSVTIIWAYIDSRRRARNRTQRLIASKALTAHLADSIVNAPTVKTFSQENLEMARNQELNTTLEALRIKDWQMAGLSSNNRMAALLLMQLVMVVFIIQLVRADPSSLATGIFAFTYTYLITTRLFDINSITRIMDESFLQAAPMTNMLREAAEIQDKPGAQALKVSRGAITFNDVHFAYAESNQAGDVFAGMNLAVKPGEKIGLVGPSGGGKSTLTRLLLRFDDLQGGAIDVDGQNIADITQESLRSAIAYVPQEPLLFHRTIRENIAYGRPQAGQAELFAASRKARAHDFIEGLGNGYDTVVGERGVKLSGGQRQRIAIARAILKNAPILVLDEATSALDSESEVLIQEALWELMKGRTAIVIAHRLSTIQRMDRIIVLDEGKIVEQGTHKELLKSKGLYARLWSHQSGGFIEE